MRNKGISPALVVALLALGIALGGTAVAASRYVITSTSQIKPSVLSSLTTAARGETHIVKSTWTFVKHGTPLEEHGWAKAKCAKGDHVVSGGYDGELAPGAMMNADAPIGLIGWQVIVQVGTSTGTSKVQAYAICVTGE